MDNRPPNTISEVMEQDQNHIDSDVVIVGGGLNGATLALALAGAGFSATLIDSEPGQPNRDRPFDGRSYAIALGSQRMLATLGLWDGLAPDSQPILQIKASDGRAGQGAAPFFLHFDHAELEEGPMGFMVEDRHLRPALMAAVAKHPTIRHLTGVRVTAQGMGRTQSVWVQLDGGDVAGQTVTARLLIGADGRRSGVAQRAGIGRMAWGYGQTALVCAIEHTRPHHGTAHQFFMPAGPLAILPLPGNRASIVWSEKDTVAADILALPDPEFLTVLQPRFGDFLGNFQQIGARYSYPLGLSLAKSLTGPRLALVGDAAHGVHPIAGQGLNLGLRDIAALAEVLTEARRRGEDIGQANTLARYQQWRRFDVAALAMVTDGCNNLFSNDNPVLRPLRDLGMGVISALPNLRRRLMREAAGLTGDLPRLMRGIPL